jgi:hypothetical protein
VLHGLDVRWSPLIVASTLFTAGPVATGHELGVGSHPARQPFPQCNVIALSPRGHIRKVTALTSRLVRLHIRMDADEQNAARDGVAWCRQVVR